MSFAIPACAALWYVDSTASGTHNGTSWATAWTNVTSVTGISAGDTIYISGGASGSSQNYPVSSWVPAEGTSGSPVTYQIGQDSSHNGTAIFTGSGTWISKLQYCNVVGDAGDGNRHFSLCNSGSTNANYSQAIYDTTGLLYCRLGYVNFGYMNDASGQGPISDEWSAEGPFEIDHIYCYVGPSCDHWMTGNGINTASAYDYCKVHDNFIYIPEGYTVGSDGADGFRDAGSVSFYNNTVIGWSDPSYPGSQHGDGIQMLSETYVKEYNNLFITIANTAIFGDNYFSPKHVQVYNNICIGTAEGMGIGDDGQSGSAGNFNDCIFANNILDDCGVIGGGIASNFSGSTFTACYVYNNIYINCQLQTTPYSSGVVFADNVNNMSHSTATSDFVSYTSGITITNNNFRLTASATALIANGTNLSSYFTTDYASSARQATGPWDIGAYNYGTNQPPPSGVNGFRIFVQ